MTTNMPSGNCNQLSAYQSFETIRRHPTRISFTTGRRVKKSRRNGANILKANVSTSVIDSMEVWRLRRSKISPNEMTHGGTHSNRTRKQLSASETNCSSQPHSCSVPFCSRIRSRGTDGHTEHHECWGSVMNWAGRAPDLVVPSAVGRRPTGIRAATNSAAEVLLFPNSASLLFLSATNQWLCWRDGGPNASRIQKPGHHSHQQENKNG